MSNAVPDVLHAKLLVRLCAALTTGLALVALLGWFLGVPSLATLGRGGVPMAPSTAVMFVLCAALVLIRSRGLSRCETLWGGLVTGWAVAIVSLTLLIMSLCGVYSEIEHIGLTIDHAPGEMPAGHMSPLTAFCFLVVSMSHLASLSSSPKRAWRGVVAWWLACLLVLVSIALLLAYLYATPLLYGTSFIPPAAPTSLAFLFVGIALLVLIPHYPWPHRSDTAHGRQGAYALVSVFVVLAAGIVLAGWLSFRHIERSYRAEVERQLSAIATLKVSDLMQWRKERLGDGVVLHRNPNFSERVRRFLEVPEDVGARSRLQAWMAQVQAAYQYERVFLLDNQGIERISVPDTPESARPQLLQVLPGIFQSRQVTFVDFHRDAPETPIHLSVAVPILGGSDGTSPLAVLVLRIDPEVYLYPFVSRWPTPSRTAETLLVRREGDEVVFLNELRFVRDSALNLRFPLSQTQLPAVKAVLGQEGIAEGRDYRGVPVLAYVCGVPDSPWSLVARMDLSEVYAPLRERLFVLVGFVCSLLFMAAAVLGMLWRRQSTLHYMERCKVAEALRESEERLRLLIEGVTDHAIYLLDADGRIVSWNTGAERLKGYRADEILGHSLSIFFPPEEQNENKPQCLLKQAGAEGHVDDEGWRVRKDGSRFWADATITALRMPDGSLRGFARVTRDLTERKRTEDRLRHLAEVLRAVRNVNQLITHEKDRDTLLRRACEIMTETRGFHSAWIATCDAPEELRAAAESGIGQGFAVVRAQLEQGKWPECCQKAMEQAGVVVMHSTELNCVKCPVVHAYRDTAALAQRLQHAGRDYGVLIVALPATAADDDEEQSLFQELCGDISYALYAIEVEQERERAEEETRQNEKRLHSLLDEAPEGIFIQSDGRFVFLNPAMVTLLGASNAEDLLGREFMDRIAPEYHGPVRMRIRAQRESKGPSPLMEQEYVRVDGTRVTVETTAVAIRWRGRDAHLVFVRDVTERKRAQERAVQAGQEWQSTFDAVNSAIWILDREQRIVRCNRTSERVFGRSCDDVLGRYCWEVIHGTPAPIPGCPVLRARASLQRESQELLLDEAWYEIVVDPIVDGEGCYAGAVHIVSDITVRKRTDEELRKLSSAVTQSPVSVVITDLEGSIEYVNPKFTEVTGYSFEEVRGQNPRILKSGETLPSEYEKMWNTITSGGEWRGEFHNKRKDGSLFWEMAFIAPIRDAAGRTTHFIGIKEEITQQKKLEEQYLQAQKMEAIGQLAGGVAHDFNNILQALVGYSSLLLDRLPEQDETHEFAEEIVRGTERASALTRQLLAFSRRQVLEMEDLDLNDVVQGVMKMVQRIIGEDIEVRMLEGERLGLVHADRGQVEQVLLNLCVNARDAMPIGGTLTIETKNVAMDTEYCSAHVWATPGQYVLLSVTDTGCGMDAETQARVFEPFFTTKEPGKGTGLGLATVYGIVRQHQGIVQVYSEVGKGTTLKVYLPTLERAKTVRRAKATERARGGTETVLVVEDDDTGRKLAARILESAGYRVLLAVNGEEALDVFEKHGGGIHLLLLDVIMPKMGGKAVYDTLAQRHPNLRFLFASGYSANVMPTGITPEEGIELIQKPYAPDMLLRKVRHVLDGTIEEKGSGRRTTP